MVWLMTDVFIIDNCFPIVTKTFFPPTKWIDCFCLQTTLGFVYSHKMFFWGFSCIVCSYSHLKSMKFPTNWGNSYFDPMNNFSIIFCSCDIKNSVMIVKNCIKLHIYKLQIFEKYAEMSKKFALRFFFCLN